MRRFAVLAVSAAGLGAVGVGAWTWHNAGPKDDPKLFANRVWAERARRDDRDVVRYLVPMDAAGKHRGLVSASSKFRFAGEVFGWSREGRSLTVELPQSRQKVTVDVRTWECGANEAPEGFDLCLELTSPGDRALKLYSRKGWRVPKGQDLPLTVPELPDPGSCPECAAAPMEAWWTAAAHEGP